MTYPYSANRFRLPRVEGLERPQHPSGRPRREPREVKRPKWNIPGDDYETPRLQRKQFQSAIGFVAPLDEDERS